MHYGGDYNPEQWPEEIWAQDVRLMSRAGVTTVTVGVFSWSRIQPAEGVFDYGWLDRVLDLLHEGGIAVDLATGTASPPPWATTAYPGMLTEDERGATRWPGSRQHWAPTSPDYLRLAADLVRSTVRRYKDHPAVVLWHLNNELGCHLTYDYSDRAAAAFRRWLRARYVDIDALNDAWGTFVWSQHYTDFDQVLPPRLTPASPNPACVLDFRRFSSQALLDVVRMEKRIVRAEGATQPVTTNMIGAWPSLDYWRFAAELDCVSDDSYPDPRDPDAFRGTAFARDLMRSLKPGTPWLLMEQAPGAVNWRDNNAPKAPGQLAALSVQAVARGADGVLFFQWRQARTGSEKFHSAMLPHAGPDTRTFREVAALGADLAALAPLPRPGGEARVALVLDWDSWWALDGPDHPARVDYLAQVRGWHATLHERGVQADFVRPGGPFDGYALVLAPCLYLLREQDASALRAFVTTGGCLLVTAFTDVVDEHDRFRPGGFTTTLGPVLGVAAMEHAGVLPGEATFGWTDESGESVVAAGELVETLAVRDARVLARFTAGPAAGEAAITCAEHGAGAAYYVATLPDAAGRSALVDHLLARRGIEPVVAGLAPKVEACARGDVVTVINHSDQAASVAVPGHEPFVLQPFGYRVLR